MAKVLDCVVNGQTYVSSDMDYYGYILNDDVYCGYDASSYKWYISILKFTTPSFSGKAKTVKFNFSIKSFSTSNVSFRYALCTSDSNYLSYRFTSSAVSDGNQVVSNTFAFTPAAYNTYQTLSLEVNASSLSPNTTYYMFVWAGDNNYSLCTMNMGSHHTVSISVDSSCIYIDNGSGWDAYEIWIDNGSSWEQYAAYIDNGSSWDECG